MAHDPDADPSPKAVEPEESDPQRRGAVMGLAITLLLVAGGLFLFHVLRNMSRIQDCVMSGRTNCAPIDSGPDGR